MAEKIRILFLCTGNSCRSQMAEAWTRQLKGALINPYSAGILKHGLNPDAVTVMREAGIDISGYRSKTVSELPADLTFHYVITLCDNAAETCPFFPAETAVMHRGFDDPPQLARGAATTEERLAPYRRVRDEIKAFILTLPPALSTT
ncbi:MAG: arsenate reductase ArsC [Deltaproteobacteria bacterium]|nr:arsenate reductase ArsC [Candidatus Anaeroferrophillus wilburensis]MBN2887881.1 arsenate reductase ArsC [Deltaproteobacteria bacterium]